MNAKDEIEYANELMSNKVEVEVKDEAKMDFEVKFIINVRL